MNDELLDNVELESDGDTDTVNNAWLEHRLEAVADATQEALDEQWQDIENAGMVASFGSKDEFSAQALKKVITNNILDRIVKWD